MSFSEICNVRETINQCYILNLAGWNEDVIRHGLWRCQVYVQSDFLDHRCSHSSAYRSTPELLSRCDTASAVLDS